MTRPSHPQSELAPATTSAPQDTAARWCIRARTTSFIPTFVRIPRSRACGATSTATAGRASAHLRARPAPLRPARLRSFSPASAHGPSAGSTSWVFVRGSRARLVSRCACWAPLQATSASTRPTRSSIVAAATTPRIQHSKARIAPTWQSLARLLSLVSIHAAWPVSLSGCALVDSLLTMVGGESRVSLRLHTLSDRRVYIPLQYLVLAWLSKPSSSTFLFETLPRRSPHRGSRRSPRLEAVTGTAGSDRWGE